MPFVCMANPSITLLSTMQAEDDRTGRLGSKLKALRLAAKLSLREAARRSGVSHARLREIEAGLDHRTKKPVKAPRDLIERLADLYQFPVDALLALARYSVEEVEAAKPPTEAEIDARELAAICVNLSVGRRRLLLGIARDIKSAADLS